MLQRRIGTSRNIVVTPLAYVTDNRVTLDAIARLGPNARGVAVIRPTVTDAELKMLADGGIRGIRFSLTDPRNAPTSIEMIEPLSKRVNALGWHVQINMGADQIVAAQDLWNRLPSTIVFDHMGHVPQPAGISHPVFDVVRRLVDKGRTWVKLSVTYDNTKDGPPAMPTSPGSLRRTSRPRPSAWCGGATGRIRTRRKSLTTRCCSICCRDGRRTKRRATASLYRIRRRSMASRNRRETGGQVVRVENLCLARISQCAPTAQSTCGGRTHTDSCR